VRIDGVTRAEIIYVLWVEQILEELNAVWNDWSEDLRFKLVFAVEQQVRTVARHRVYVDRQTIIADSVRRAARTARSAISAERLGRIEQGRLLAREALAMLEQAHLQAAVCDSRGVFPVMVDAIKAEALRLGLRFPPWWLIDRLVQLAASGRADAIAKGRNHRNSPARLRRSGRGRFVFATLTASQARALLKAERIAVRPTSSR
jgi:hypothetical protein